MKIPKPSKKKTNKEKLDKLKADIDELVRQILIAQYGYTCQLSGYGCNCSTDRNKDNHLIVQVNHKITRKVNRLRWDFRNVFLGCKGHNTWAHYNELSWDKLWRRLTPQDAKYLDLTRHGIMKVNEFTLGALKTKFERKLKNIKRLSAEGSVV